jgi:Tfp pilus assembly major pilin PilA
MNYSNMYKTWIRLIEFVVIAAILSIMAAVFIPKLYEVTIRAAATRDLSNAHTVYNSAKILMATGTTLKSGDVKSNIELKSLAGEIPDSATCLVFIANGDVNSVTFMTAGSPAGLQTYPNNN